MKAKPFGTHQMTDADRAYNGSRFAEVCEALFANPYQRVWGAPGESPLPTSRVTLGGFLRGILPFGMPYLFGQTVRRAVDSHADLRWGEDGQGFLRFLHPNGVCLTGEWLITEETPYTGYFRQGSRGLLVGRYSTCCTETRRGYTRSLSLVGKLFPTTDPEHREPLRPAHFITQQDLGGERTDFLNDAELRNAPDTRSWRRGFGVPILMISGILFAIVDRAPSIRQLYQIAELGKSVEEPTRTPLFLRLLVASEQPRIPGDRLDFRDEVMAQIYDRGDPQPKRTLTFHMEVTDEGTTRGLPIFERRTFQNWRRIGRITFTKAVVSYNGDRVIHFNHPTWRGNPNDPGTATRIQERKVH